MMAGKLGEGVAWILQEKVGELRRVVEEELAEGPALTKVVEVLGLVVGEALRVELVLLTEEAEGERLSRVCEM